jgi:hypothetical protein
LKGGNFIMNKTLEKVATNIGKLLISQSQDKICSKVCGRENYVIRLYDGKITFSGTKGQYMRQYDNHDCVPLMEAYRYNWLFFTYKKDWFEALKQLTE